MSTAKEIIDLSYKESKRNVPDVLADEATEMVPVLYRRLVAYFQMGARVNPSFFGKTSNVTYSSGWARPADAEAIYRIEKSDGTEIHVVRFDQQNAEPGFPSVYRWGQVYKIANANGAELQTSDALTFYYSKVPDALASVNASIDSLWPERFDELLALDLAIYLANKEGGERAADELQRLTGERDLVLQQFAAALEHETVGEVREYGRQQSFVTPAIVPGGEG